MNDNQAAVHGIKVPSIRTGRTFGLLPHAHLCEAGVIRMTFVGFTLKHARKRAQRALGRCERAKRHCLDCGGIVSEAGCIH